MIDYVYQYTSRGESVFTVGKRLLPEAIAQGRVTREEIDQGRTWLRRPAFFPGNFIFYFTEEGKKKYEERLLPLHARYVPEIHCEKIAVEDLVGRVIECDEHQVITEVDSPSFLGGLQ